MNINISKTERALFRLTVFLLLSGPSAIMAQETKREAKQISLQEAIRLAKSNNKTIASFKTEKEAVQEDIKDAKASILPSVGVSGSYQRFTKLTLYTNGLSDSKSVPKNPGPNGADLGASANFNIYSGGRTRSLLSEQDHRFSLAEVSLQETSGNITLQVAGQYLDMMRLESQKKLVNEQIVRAQTRLKSITSLYNNQKVTRSDLLRAELNLSNARLVLQQTDNDIAIAGRKLAVLTDIGPQATVEPTDALGTEQTDLGEIQDLVSSAPSSSFGIQKFNENIKILNDRIKGIKSNYYPVVSAYSAYGISYPNTIFNPPVDQAYSIGFVGIRLQYNISSLYHNKHKVSAANIRMKETEIQKAALADNVSQEADALGIKYREALNRIGVIQKQIEQAEVNYKIVSAKYFNQLALLTDLLDADNILQESRYNLIQARTALQTLYYRLQYTAGKL